MREVKIGYKAIEKDGRLHIGFGVEDPYLEGVLIISLGDVPQILLASVTNNPEVTLFMDGEAEWKNKP